MSRHLLKAIVPILALVLLLPACQTQEPAPVAQKTVGSKSAATVGKPFAAAKTIDKLTAGAAVSGALTTGDRKFDDGSFYDVWPYQASAGDQVTFTLTSDDFDTYLIVRVWDGSNVNGETVGFDDDSAGDLNSQVSVTFASAGTYAVFANSAFADAQGKYRLSASGGSSPQTQAPGGFQPIAVNEVVSGSLATGDVTLGEGVLADLYTFEAQAGSVITTAVRSTEFDAMLYIGRIAANGDVLTLFQDDDGGGGTDARGEWLVEETGTYIVAATAYAAGTTGAYVMAVGLSDPVDYAARYPTGGDPNGKYALLVGIDDYPGSGSDLPSSVDDVMVFRQSLIDDLGFSEANIKLITDSEANRDHIITAFQRHLGQAGPSGSAVFYYSGHGTQLDENLGTDDEPDGKDEAIFIWGNGGMGSVLVDEEIGALANRLPTDRVLIVLDACHSGTGTRGAGGDFPVKEVNFADIKAMVELPMTVVTNKGMAASGAAEGEGNDIVNGPKNHVLLAAAANTEYALASHQEWPAIGRKASVFTYYLTQSIKEMGTGTTFEQLMNDVRPKTSNYSAAQDNSQTVQLEGQAGTQTLAQFFGL